MIAKIPARLPNLVPSAWLPDPSLGTFLEAQSSLATLPEMCRDEAADAAGNLPGPCILLSLSHTAVLHFDVRTNGTNSFTSTA